MELPCAPMNLARCSIVNVIPGKEKSWRTDGDDSRDLKTPLQVWVSKGRDKGTRCAVHVDGNKMACFGLVLGPLMRSDETAYIKLHKGADETNLVQQLAHLFHIFVMSGISASHDLLKQGLLYLRSRGTWLELPRRHLADGSESQHGINLLKEYRTNRVLVDKVYSFFGTHAEVLLV
jgi:hypothetical protein